MEILNARSILKQEMNDEMNPDSKKEKKGKKVTNADIALLIS